jgi:hypothetical protein
VRVCLSFAFGAKKDKFFGWASYIFKSIAEVIEAKINKVSVEKSLF